MRWSSVLQTRQFAPNAAPGDGIQAVREQACHRLLVDHAGDPALSVDTAEAFAHPATRRITGVNVVLRQRRLRCVLSVATAGVPKQVINAPAS